MAGVTKPALYYHFGSKEGLLLAILQRGGAGVRRGDRARPSAGPAPPATGILALCEDLYGLFAKNVPVVRVAHAVFLGPAEMRAARSTSRVFDRSDGRSG